jgi:hydroxymethylglutaryl-CoA reductase (NADPH)
MRHDFSVVVVVVIHTLILLPCFYRSEEHSTALTSAPKNKLAKTVHPPAPSAPVCADPTSFAPSCHKKTDLKELQDGEILSLLLQNQIKDYELEKRLDPHRAVVIRRMAMNAKLASLGLGEALESLPYTPSLDYSRVFGANCEIVVGYVPLPVGMVGPLTLNGETVYVPMATTEGCLVASTNRGAKAISQGSGAFAVILKDGITRAPCVRMASAREAATVALWCREPHNFETLKNAFESTTSFGKLQSCTPTVAGKNVYLRLVCFAGDAMGMNMVSKGSLAVIQVLQREFPTLQLVALSGNMCTDKKAAATNWIEGRGKSVVVEATIPASVVRSTLKTTVKSIVDTNLQKNLVGSAMAGTVGGFNAHASNIVTAVFLATGQDPAQNVESSNCITLMEETVDGDLWISCTMPSIEVGTVGGGTSLPAQSACLDAIGVKGGAKDQPGENARKLATVVAAATMAGELSLLAALAANTLVQAHMTHNRKPASK